MRRTASLLLPLSSWCLVQYVAALSSDVEYLNSRDATIMGSRNGHAPIYMWFTLTRKGYEGMRKDVERCLRNAHVLKVCAARFYSLLLLNNEQINARSRLADTLAYQGEEQRAGHMFAPQAVRLIAYRHKWAWKQALFQPGGLGVSLHSCV